MNNQMNRIFIVTKMMILSVFISLFVSCQMFYTKENYLIDFKDFIETIKTDNEQYTEKDWINADLEFQQLSEEKFLEFQDELTTDERFTIGKLKGIYSALKFKKDAKVLGNQLKEALDQTEGLVKGALETLEDE